MRTEANEHYPDSRRTYAAWQEQIAKGETMGVRQMYEDAYWEAVRRERPARLRGKKYIVYPDSIGFMDIDNARAYAAVRSSEDLEAEFSVESPGGDTPKTVSRFQGGLEIGGAE